MESSISQTYFIMEHFLQGPSQKINAPWNLLLEMGCFLNFF